eukprot:m.254128 g.254128  ORF g.254128 m.254128 type:complete len:313 (-) comp17720_c0_seq1:100-1038(-)
MQSNRNATEQTSTNAQEEQIKTKVNHKQTKQNNGKGRYKQDEMWLISIQSSTKLHGYCRWLLLMDLFLSLLLSLRLPFIFSFPFHSLLFCLCFFFLLLFCTSSFCLLACAADNCSKVAWSSCEGVSLIPVLVRGDRLADVVARLAINDQRTRNNTSDEAGTDILDTGELAGSIEARDRGLRNRVEIGRVGIGRARVVGEVGNQDVERSNWAESVAGARDIPALPARSIAAVIVPQRSSVVLARAEVQLVGVVWEALPLSTEGIIISNGLQGSGRSPSCARFSQHSRADQSKENSSKRADNGRRHKAGHILLQ